MSMTADAIVKRVADVQRHAYLSPIKAVRPFELGELETVILELSRVERLVAETQNADISRGLGRIGPDSVCWWNYDARRVTLSLVPGGYTIEVSCSPDPIAPEVIL